jgi:hypothetical protein
MLDDPAGRTANAETATALQSFFASERRAGTSPEVAFERTKELAKRLAIPRRIVVDGRAADVISAWSDHDEDGRTISGYDYRFDGELTVHWIKGNSPRLRAKQNG